MKECLIALAFLICGFYEVSANDGIDKGTFKLAGRDVQAQKKTVRPDYATCYAQAISEKKSLVVYRGLSEKALTKASDPFDSSIVCVADEDDERFPLGRTEYAFVNGGLFVANPCGSSSCAGGQCYNGQCGVGCPNGQCFPQQKQQMFVQPKQIMFMGGSGVGGGSCGPRG